MKKCVWEYIIRDNEQIDGLDLDEYILERFKDGVFWGYELLCSDQLDELLPILSEKGFVIDMRLERA